MTKKLILFAILMLTVQSSFGGHVKFWPSDRFPQEERVGTLPDHERAELNMTDRWTKHDNRIRALSFHWVTPGTRIRLYARPNASENYDWVEIEVKRWMPDYELRTMEFANDVNNSSIWLRYHDSNKAEPFSPGDSTMGVPTRDLKGINGNVSHIKLFPVLPHNPPFEARLNLCLQETYRFRQKHGAAEEYRDQGSWYRAWYPTVDVRQDNSTRIHFKLEHIRNNASDDRANISMSFDVDRNLVDTSTNVTMGNDKFISNTSDETWEDLPAAAKANKYAVIARAASVTAGKLYEAGTGLFDRGGRENFPNVIENVMVEYGEAISGCDANKYDNPAPSFPPVE